METYAKCLYASKPCDNTRSFKDNGTLHRLCLMHRVKANDAQRRWHSRQKGTSSASSVTTTPDAGSMAKPSRTKRRRSTPVVIKSEKESEASEAKTPKRCRPSRPSASTQPHKKIAMMRVPLLAPSFPIHFTGLLDSHSLPPPLSGYTQSDTSSVISDQELAQLGDFLVELDEAKLYADLGATGVFSAHPAFDCEKEQLFVNHPYVAETTVYCL